MNIFQFVNGFKLYDHFSFHQDVCDILANTYIFVRYLYRYPTLCREASISEFDQESILIDLFQKTGAENSVDLENCPIYKVSDIVNVHSSYSHARWA